MQELRVFSDLMASHARRSPATFWLMIFLIVYGVIGLAHDIAFFRMFVSNLLISRTAGAAVVGGLLLWLIRRRQPKPRIPASLR